jgi:hypothetical protein
MGCDGFDVAVAETSCSGEADRHYDRLHGCGKVCVSESRMRSSCRVSDERVNVCESVCENDSDGVEENGCESHMNPHCRSSGRVALSRLY